VLAARAGVHLVHPQKNGSASAIADEHQPGVKQHLGRNATGQRGPMCASFFLAVDNEAERLARPA
jgi:hypothetical protein